MANTITGKIHHIEPTITLTSKKDATKSIQKRTIVLSVTRYDSITGEQIGFENFPAFEFIGDRCALLDNFTQGQLVTISFDLQGSCIKGDDGKDRWFTSVRGYKIEAYQRGGQAQPQPTQQPAPQPQAQYQPVSQPMPPIQQPTQPAQQINDSPF